MVTIVSIRPRAFGVGPWDQSPTRPFRLPDLGRTRFGHPLYVPNPIVNQGRVHWSAFEGGRHAEGRARNDSGDRDPQRRRGLGVSGRGRGFAGPHTDVRRTGSAAIEAG